MWPPQSGQCCRAGTSTRSRSGRGRADTLAIPRLQEPSKTAPQQRPVPASFANLEKKSLRAAEQQRAEVAEARARWRELQSGLDVTKLVSMRPESSSEARFGISPGKLPVLSRCWD